LAYWLTKSEPGTWSWDDHVKKSVEQWDGVRSHQSCNNMKDMKIGEKIFFYHSVKEKQIVGVMEVVSDYYLDPSDPTCKFGMVDLKALYSLKTPVTLVNIKANERLQDIALVRQSRLSVCPISDEEWQIICEMGGLSTYRLCAVNEIPDGNSIEFMAPFQGRSRSLIAVRKDGRVYLYLNSCPHTGLTLDFTPDQFLNLEKTHI
jgi:predicted RNA-binding protein with PUA-like domain